MTTVREEFLFLNRLRESGATNMFGASPYLAKAFDLDKREASDILVEWISWIQENPSNRDL